MLGHFVQSWSPKYWCDNLGDGHSTFVQWLRQPGANYMTFWLLLCSEALKPKVGIGSLGRNDDHSTRNFWFGDGRNCREPSIIVSLSYFRWVARNAFSLGCPFPTNNLKQLFESEAKSELIILDHCWWMAIIKYLLIYCSNKIAWDAEYCFYQLWANISQI